MEYLDHYIERSNEFVWRVIDDQAFLLTEDGTKIHMLNRVGSLIWQSCTGHSTVQNIISKIVEKFEIDEETAKKETVEFVQKLAEMSILNLSKKSF